MPVKVVQVAFQHIKPKHRHAHTINIHRDYVEYSVCVCLCVCVYQKMRGTDWREEKNCEHTTHKSWVALEGKCLFISVDSIKDPFNYTPRRFIRAPSAPILVSQFLFAALYCIDGVCLHIYSHLLMHLRTKKMEVKTAATAATNAKNFRGFAIHVHYVVFLSPFFFFSFLYIYTSVAFHFLSFRFHSRKM